MAQLPPRNLLERHYVEKIAAASWRLRRLNRWQAQLFEDETLTEDERLNKLDKVLRHETALHRQIDTSVKMLNKDVPQFYKGRARDRALVDTMQTELDCRENRENELEVEFEARERLKADGGHHRRPRPRLHSSGRDAKLPKRTRPLLSPPPPLHGATAPRLVREGLGVGTFCWGRGPLRTPQTAKTNPPPRLPGRPPPTSASWD